MCRYAMTSYKSHFACFDCRKTFKRQLKSDIQGGYNNVPDNPATCPECNGLMANMGLDFEAPKKKDVKTWHHISTLYQVGITFHSCGCSGPGYIPKNSKDLINYLNEVKVDYLKHQSFWARRRTNPQSQSDIDRDNQKNINFLIYASNEGSKKKPLYNSTKELKYWSDKVSEVENKILFVLNSN